jgi:hypothetical protein
MLVIEVSLIMISTLILVYLRSKESITKNNPKIIPKYSIFVVTSSYPVLKITWFTFVILRARKEELVRLICL